MTAINAFLTPSRAYLMTDASIYTPQGLVIGFGQKAIALPSLKAAIAVQGLQKTAALLAMEMSVTFDSMDELAAAREEYLDCVLNMIGQGFAEDTRHVRIVAVGWSDAQNRPIGFYYDAATYVGDEIDGYVMAPLPDEEQEVHLRRQKCLLDENLRLRDFDPVRHGLPIMEAQRRMRIVPVGAEMEDGISIVGGHVLLTEVSKSGVKQNVVHRWPDIIGENIQASPLKQSAQGLATANLKKPRGLSKIL